MKTKTISLSILVLLMVCSPVLALSLERQIASSALPGSAFSVTYQTLNAPPANKWFIAWEDTITGGCSPISYKNFMAQETGGDSSQTKTFIAPSTPGTCKFSGFYQAADGVQTNMPDFVITIGNVSSCTPNWQTGMWTNCNNSTQTRTVTDLNNCGTLTGQPATSQACTGTGACTENWVCSSFNACVNGTQSRTCADSNTCGTTTSKPVLTQTCSLGGLNLYCEYATKVAFFDVNKNGAKDCTDGSVVAGLGLVALFLLIKLMGK